jgi:hypothetical protein
LKLIRELDKLQGQLPRVSKEKPIFGVMHVNNSAEHGLIVDNVSIYTTVQDANDRVLDFWDREYGTGMFTNISRHAEDSTMPLKFEYIDNMADHHPYHGVPSQNKSEDYPSGGILTNNSQWKIDNMCLSLKQKSNEVEKKVYVLISYVENHGIHI